MIDELYLPVLRITVQHRDILGFGDLAIILSLDVLDLEGSLDGVILGESAGVSLLQKLSALILPTTLQAAVLCARGRGSEVPEARACG